MKPQRPDHNHPQDSLCLYQSCPRGSWDTALAVAQVSDYAAGWRDAKAAMVPAQEERLDVERLARAIGQTQGLSMRLVGEPQEWVEYAIADAIAAEYAATPTNPLVQHNLGFPWLGKTGTHAVNNPGWDGDTTPSRAWDDVFRAATPSAQDEETPPGQCQPCPESSDHLHGHHRHDGDPRWRPGRECPAAQEASDE